MSRKYRHRGYQDSGDDRDRDRDRDRGPAARPRDDLSFEEKIQRKSMRHAIDRETREVLRCHACGTVVDDFGAIGFDSACAKCGEALHCCRNCAHFNTSARWQCSADIPEPIGDKLRANRCGEYSARLVLDHTGRRGRAAGPGGGGSSNDPREAFNNLFKN